MKCLCDSKERSGLQLPNIKLYYKAVGLWIQEWIKLENRQLLTLEGYNMIYGWHAYLFYQKQEKDNYLNITLLETHSI